MTTLNDDRARLKAIIAEGQGAKEWLEHPNFRHAITLQKADLLSAFEKTKFKDKEEREEIWRKVQALNSIVSLLERQIRDASNAEQSLFEKFKERFR